MATASVALDCTGGSRGCGAAAAPGSMAQGQQGDALTGVDGQLAPQGRAGQVAGRSHPHLQGRLWGGGQALWPGRARAAHHQAVAAVHSLAGEALQAQVGLRAGALAAAAAHGRPAPGPGLRPCCQPSSAGNSWASCAFAAARLSMRSCHSTRRLGAWLLAQRRCCPSPPLRQGGEAAGAGIGRPGSGLSAL